MLVDGEPISAALFDFALFFHNAKRLLASKSGPYFYLPKMESHLEARLWNDIFVVAQDELGIPVGSIKATALIETVVAAFEMDESCTSYATIRRASTLVAGITSSVASRNFDPTRIFVSQIERRSR